MRDHNYYVYIITNKHRTTLYIGVTNDLGRRISRIDNGWPSMEEMVRDSSPALRDQNDML